MSHFWLDLRVLQYFMCVNSEGSGETARMLGAYAISTIISWADSNGTYKTNDPQIYIYHHRIFWHQLLKWKQLTATKVSRFTIPHKASHFPVQISLDHHLSEVMVNTLIVWYCGLRALKQQNYMLLSAAMGNEPPHSKTNKMTIDTFPMAADKSIWATSWQNQQNDCAPSEDSDQPGQLPSLIRVFAVHMNKAWVLSYPLSAQRRLWSD